jgi:hypothetical protein
MIRGLERRMMTPGPGIQKPVADRQSPVHSCGHLSGGRREEQELPHTCCLVIFPQQGGLAMRRSLLSVSFVFVMLLGVLSVSGSRTAAQEGTASDGFVGAWWFTNATGDLPSLGTFTADGNFILSNLPTEPLYEGAPFEILLLSGGHGVWEATGEDTAAFTYVYLYADDTGAFQSSTIISGTLELGADGQALSGEYAFQVSQPDGTLIHAERGMIEATRIGIIPMDGLAPAATPAS